MNLPPSPHKKRTIGTCACIIWEIRKYKTCFKVNLQCSGGNGFSCLLYLFLFLNNLAPFYTHNIYVILVSCQLLLLLLSAYFVYVFVCARVLQYMGLLICSFFTSVSMPKYIMQTPPKPRVQSWRRSRFHLHMFSFGLQTCCIRETRFVGCWSLSCRWILLLVAAYTRLYTEAKTPQGHSSFLPQHSFNFVIFYLIPRNASFNWKTHSTKIQMTFIFSFFFRSIYLLPRKQNLALCVLPYILKLGDTASSINHMLYVCCAVAVLHKVLTKSHLIS